MTSSRIAIVAACGAALVTLLLVSPGTGCTEEKASTAKRADDAGHDHEGDDHKGDDHKGHDHESKAGKKASGRKDSHDGHGHTEPGQQPNERGRGNDRE